MRSTVMSLKRGGAPLVGVLIASLMGALALAAVSPAAAQEAAADDAPVTIDGLAWQARSNGQDVPWGEAEAHCDALELDGHDDWRLPTLDELMSVHEPANEAAGYVVSPLRLDACCLWSSTSLEELGAEEVGVRSDQAGDPASYHWGFLYPSGIRYYSVDFMPDGQARCVRDAEAG